MKEVRTRIEDGDLLAVEQIANAFGVPVNSEFHRRIYLMGLDGMLAAAIRRRRLAEDCPGGDRSPTGLAGGTEES